MNNIFLTSVAAEVLERICEFLPKEPSEYKIVFVPTASNLYPNAPWVDNDREKLVTLGFAVQDFQLEGASPEAVINTIHTSDIIFVAGGNTFYLLEQARKSGFLEVVKEAVANGKIYIGSSAGAVLAAPDIRYVELFDNPSPDFGDTASLALVNFRILPHFGNPKYADLHDKVLAGYQSKDSRLIPVKDNEFLLKNGDIQKVGTP